MAFAPIQLFSTPQEDYAGYWVKFFEQGTVTPLVMATDAAGGTTLAKAEISSGGTVPIGFIKTAGNALLNPFVDGDYDCWLFPTAAEADANDTTNATQVADNINSDPSNGLADAADATNGDALVGVKKTNATSSSATTQHQVNQDRYIDVVADYGATGDGVTDDTAAFTAAEASVSASGGGTIFVPAGSYLKDRTFPPSNCTYIFDAGATMIQAVAASNIWRVQQVDNVHFYGNGCTFDGSTVGATSAVFQFSEATNCSIHDVLISSAASGEDGINVGGAASGTFSENILIKGCIIDGSKRNGISVIASKHTVIDSNEIKNVTGAPGAGIDIEANVYDVCEDTIIINNRVHDNQNNGIVAVFGTQIKILNNTVYDNGAEGIATGAGGAQFNTGVFRARDRRGVSNFNVANGEITVSNGSAKGVNGMPIGTVVIFNTSGGGAVPAELQSPTRWIVSYVDTASSDIIRLAQAIDYDEQLSFSDPGAGTLDPDPDVSEVDMLTYVEGQMSDILIEGNTVRSNDGTREIFIGTSVNVNVINNFIFPDAGTQGISCTFCRDVTTERNRIFYDRDNAGTDTGINVSVTTNYRSVGDEVYYSGGNGIRFSSMSHARILDAMLYGCSHNLLQYCMRIDASPFSRILNCIIRTDDMTGETHGIFADSNSTDMLVERNTCKSVGTTNATSISLSGARSINRDNVLWDGSLSFEDISVLPDEATPSVKGISNIRSGGTTTITDFDDGVEGQKIYFISGHAITITDGTNIFLNGSANFVMANTDTLTLICKADLKWYELGRAVS